MKYMFHNIKFRKSTFHNTEDRKHTFHITKLWIHPTLLWLDLKINVSPFSDIYIPPADLLIDHIDPPLEFSNQGIATWFIRKVQYNRIVLFTIRGDLNILVLLPYRISIAIVQQNVNFT